MEAMTVSADVTGIVFLGMGSKCNLQIPLESEAWNIKSCPQF